MFSECLDGRFEDLEKSDTLNTSIPGASMLTPSSALLPSLSSSVLVLFVLPRLQCSVSVS